MAEVLIRTLALRNGNISLKTTNEKNKYIGYVVHSNIYFFKLDITKTLQWRVFVLFFILFYLFLHNLQILDCMYIK